MTLQDYINKYNNKSFTDVKEMTAFFNKLQVDERKVFLKYLDGTAYKDFIKKIRQQAVKDFWWHEREAILNGECTRDWTPEQIESIMNISETSGKMSTNAGKGLQIDENGVYILDEMGNKSYYGHHMVDVSTHPEYAGDWRNIQALTYDEHYNGAHPNHDTTTPTEGYYNVETKKTEVINVDAEDFSFDEVGYPSKRKCIFKSDADMKGLYDNFDDLTDGEKLALKNADLALENGDFEKFKVANDLAEKYKSKDFYDKIGLETDANIKKKYGILSDCDNAEVVKQYQFYEYASRHGYDLDVTVYVDENGKVIATSLDKDYVPKDTDYKISMRESIELSEEELMQYIDNAKDAPTDGESTNDNNDSDSENQDTKDSVDEEMKDSSDTETNGDEVKDVDDNTETTDDVDDTNDKNEAGDDLKDTDEEIDNTEDINDTNEGENAKDSTDTSTESGEEGTTDTTNDSSEVTDTSDTASDSEIPQDSGETKSGNEDVKGSGDSAGSDEVQDVDDNVSSDTEIAGAEDNTSNDSDMSDTTDNTSDGADTSDVTDTTNNNTEANTDGSSKKNTDTIVALPGGDDTSDSKVTDGTNSDVTDTSQSDTGSNKTTDTTSGSSTSSDNGSTSGDSTSSSSSSTNGGNTTSNGSNSSGNNTISNSTSSGGNSTSSSNSSTNSSSSTSSGSTTSSSSGSNKGQTNKEKLSDNGKKMVDAYENATGEKVDVDATPGMASKINKYADIVDKVGDGADLLDAGIAYAKAIKQAASGDTNGACKTLSDYGFSTLAGMGASAFALKIVGMFSVNPILGFAFVLALGCWASAKGEDFSDWWFREVLGLYDEAGAYTYPVDPLILDLDGDGIETVSVEDGVNFDFDNNGFAEKTGWVGKDDGLLVRDINGNGQIDNGGELFGDLTVAEDFTAENGFEALKYFDTNEDNIINHLDEIYSELRVWQDANRNEKVA